MRKSRQVRLMLAGVSGILFLLGLVPVGASSANISHSYHSDDTIAAGSIVSLDSGRSNYVQAANTDNAGRLLGVAVATNDSLLAVDETPDQAQIATSGNAKTLVSTINGDIKVGDEISVSPFTGIGMKAVNGSKVIGLSETDFSSDSSGASGQEVTDKNGKKTTITVGFVSITIAIGTSDNTSGLSDLSPLQRLGHSITGHTVSTVRVLISMAVAIVALVSLVTLIYASIYGGIISIGRNPLAKYAVFRSIFLVLGMVLVTGLIAGLTIFFLLR